ncbi:hypothetical protein FHX74_001679 [Friedmanniella endophytica]|uniref:DUF2993 domain-containing protein n=1 Tax=Microlunatus kandeliicorticis TaxID=1759536 RepID=A0A7W3IRS4_9ACTN|nr:DUF2993 domain-containing protein [Microlunatus kandeliicorticis]MBA8794074.1 hypothetical protein [Microlunatus kandeliicorticis]
MPDSSRSARRSRSWTAAVAVVIALLLLGWAGDRLARRSAEDLISRDLASATGSSRPPSVDIGGGLFLPQVVRGAYDEVDVRVDDLHDGPLTIARVDARLTDVRVPFHDVLVRDVRTIGVGHSDATVRLTYDALNRYFTATGRRLTISRAEGDQSVRLTGTVQVLDQRLEASAEVGLAVTDGNLRLIPQTVSTNGGTLGATARLLLRQRLTVTIPLGSLPFSQRLSGISATDDGLVITAVGDGIVVQP